MKYFVFNEGMENPGVDFVVVDAETKREAEEKFIINYALNDAKNNREYYTDAAVNMCFSERFFIGCFDGHGDCLHNIEELQSIIEKRVHDFFAEKPEYVSVFLKEWYKGSECMDLPDDVVKFMAVKECSQKDFMSVNVFEFKEITIK